MPCCAMPRHAVPHHAVPHWLCGAVCFSLCWGRFAEGRWCCASSCMLEDVVWPCCAMSRRHTTVLYQFMYAGACHTAVLCCLTPVCCAVPVHTCWGMPCCAVPYCAMPCCVVPRFSLCWGRFAQGRSCRAVPCQFTYGRDVWLCHAMSHCHAVPVPACWGMPCHTMCSRSRGHSRDVLLRFVELLGQVPC